MVFPGILQIADKVSAYKKVSQMCIRDRRNIGIASRAGEKECGLLAGTSVEISDSRLEFSASASGYAFDTGGIHETETADQEIGRAHV